MRPSAFAKYFGPPVVFFPSTVSLIQGLALMKRLSLFSLFVVIAGGTLPAQIPIPRVNAEIDASGVFPVGGYVTNAYSAGPGLRVGGELRLARYLAADAGWTGAWLVKGNCDPHGCFYPRYENKLLDYGLRGVLPLAGGRVELSIGVGGGYIWYDKLSDDSFFGNGSLFQYSGKAAVALDRGGHWRVNFTVRTWRDLGRPIQQWLSTAAGISYGFGTVR